MTIKPPPTWPRLLLMPLIPAVLQAVGVTDQAAATGMQFEAASIKASAPGSGGLWSTRGGPGSSDPGLYRCDKCSLSMLITQAYGIMDYQLSGPGWMDGERFDVLAKIPQGASKEQFRAMLQNLLSERFKLAVHRGKKETRVYDLVIAKDGLKLKETAGMQPEETPPAARKDTVAKQGQQPGTDEKGYPVLSSDCNGCIRMANGKIAMRLGKASMEDLAEILSGQLGRPVRNGTALTGKYDIELRFDTGETPRAAAEDPAAAPPPDDGFGPSVAQAVESQLGLRLEARKGDVDAIIVDRVERTPTGN